LKHLKNEGDSTVRQDPGVNSKKKPDSDEEENEEE
jgi:hypothetical protein